MFTRCAKAPRRPDGPSTARANGYASSFPRGAKVVDPQLTLDIYYAKS